MIGHLTGIQLLTVMVGMHIIYYKIVSIEIGKHFHKDAPVRIGVDILFLSMLYYKFSAKYFIEAFENLEEVDVGFDVQELREGETFEQPYAEAEGKYSDKIIYPASVCFS